MVKYLTILLLLIYACSCSAHNNDIIVGAERTQLYVPSLKGKTVGIVSNHSSLIKEEHLVDSLLSLGVNIKCIFCPEHGFRGTADAGKQINSNFDEKTKLNIVSLYGKSKKPSTEVLSGIDIMIFDIQDVGVRFYTYISTLHYVMEACAENNIQLLILDRPNPNGFYVDGPVLDMAESSFVGMHPVPVVHGMTVGEYAQMINGEKWLKNGVKCELIVIPCLNYNHTSPYTLPVKPSPNLPNMQSIYLYPSLCMFEGTVISIGRGTSFPFQTFGHPSFSNYGFEFTPKPTEGASSPKLNNKKCFGVDLRAYAFVEDQSNFNLTWIIEAYNNYPNKNEFFNSFFIKLGGSKLKNQIESGVTEQTIKASWEKELADYKIIRTKYLIYK